MTRLVLMFVFTLLVCSISFIACEEDSTPTSPTPTIPHELSVTDFSENSISLSWKLNDDFIAGFRIFRAEADGEFSQIIQLDDSESRIFADLNLTEGTLYRYKLKTFQGDAESGFSNIISATTLPAAPSDLVVNRISESELKIIWIENSLNEDNYEIQRREDSIEEFTTRVTLGANLNEYSDIDLTTNTTYHYRARALQGEASSNWSNIATGFTKTDTPIRPENLTAELRSGKNVELKWTDVSDNEIGFVVEMSPSDIQGWRGLDSLGTDTEEMQVNNLVSSREYNFRVYAYNSFGNSDYSEFVTVMTDPGPPLPPSNFNVEIPEFSHTKLTWEDESTDEQGFIIEKKESHEDIEAWEEIASVENNVSEHSDFNLTAGASYDYRIASFNEIGNSVWVTILGVQISDGPPDAPVDLSAQGISSSEIQLNWTDNSFNENGFIVELGQTDSGEWIEVDSMGANFTTLIIDMLDPETEYNFRVCAFNTDGNSAFSNEADGSTLPAPPTAPSDLTARVVGFVNVELNWVDNSNDETEFLIEMSREEENEFNVVSSTEPNVNVYLDAGLEEETIYQYRVKALSSETGLESGYSNVAITQTEINLIVFSDDFEDYDVGAPPPENSGWDVRLGGEAGLTVSDQFVLSGEKSIHFMDPINRNDNSILFRHEFEPSTGTRTNFSLYFPEHGTHFAIRGGNERSNIAWEIWFIDNGDIAIRNSNQFQLFDGVPAERWFNIEIIATVESNSFEVFLDGHQVGDQFSFTEASESLGSIVFVCFSTGEPQNIYWENAFLDDLVIEEVEGEDNIFQNSSSTGQGISIFDMTVGPVR